MEGRFTVGAGDNDVEVVAPLAGVGGLLNCYRDAPESAFEVGRAGWVGACRSRVYGWIALNVYVECEATCRLIAEGGARECIVAGKRIEAHVVGRTHGATLVREDLIVPIWFGGTSCKCLEIYQYQRRPLCSDHCAKNLPVG